MHGRMEGKQWKPPWWCRLEEHMVEAENGDGTRFSSEEGWHGAMENARCSGSCSTSTVNGVDARRSEGGAVWEEGMARVVKA